MERQGRHKEIERRRFGRDALQRRLRHRLAGRTEGAVGFHPLDRADVAGRGKAARGGTRIAVQLHGRFELPFDDAHALGKFLCDDVEQEACLLVALAQRAPAMRLDEALVKDDFHDSLSEIAGCDRNPAAPRVLSDAQRPLQRFKACCTLRPLLS